MAKSANRPIFLTGIQSYVIIWADFIIKEYSGLSTMGMQRIAAFDLAGETLGRSQAGRG
jgi:hypothetical protein